MNRPDDKRRITRRQFVQILAALSVQWPIASQAMSRPSDADDYYSKLDEPWLTLAAVQEHLFPADDTSPGAEDIMALRFLRNMLDAPDTDEEEKTFILNGVNWLNDLAKKNHQSIFIQLEATNKETILRTVEQSRAGSRWLSLMMTYIIEALLADPAYGGNYQRRGWEWLEHIAGFPTPDADRVYYKLGAYARSRRSTKA